MTTTIKIKTNTIKAVLLLTIINVTFACSNPSNNPPKADATTQTENNTELITITGTVKKITAGKDGYTADVETDKDGIYAALVSISNVGGPEQHKDCAVGDQVSFKGIPSVLGNTKTLMVKEIISITPYSGDTQMLITSNSFRGIQVGDPIAKHSDYAKKSKMKTAEGNFEVYQIKDFENNPAGYFMADPNNKLLVGNIIVESSKAETDKGISVGSTFKDLLNAFPNIEVHGSESEGRTYAQTGNISYRLATPNFTYDVDKTKIPTTTKITQIIINRVVKK
jgi:hypothetical protein